MKYSERAKKSKEDRNLKIPGGKYKGAFKSFECKPNGKGNMMMTIGLMPTMCLTEEVLTKTPDIINKLIGKKKEARLYLTLHNPAGKMPYLGFDQQLEILVDAGYDVDQCRPQEEDPNYEDFKSMWHDMLAKSPQVTFNVRWEKEDDQFPKVTVTGIEPHPDTVANKAQAMGAATQTVAAAASAVTAPPPPPAVTKSSLRANGWSDEQILASEYKDAPEV